MPLTLDHPSISVHCIGEEPERTENLFSLSWCGQSWTESTSVQTLSSSVCGPNREISRKALKVITLDKKGICSGSTAADVSTFSYFLGTLVTEVWWNFEAQYSMSVSWLWCHYIYYTYVGCCVLMHWSAALHWGKGSRLQYCPLLQIDQNIQGIYIKERTSKV